MSRVEAGRDEAEGRPRPLALIVEDNPANLFLTQKALERGGYRTAEARSAEAALAWLEHGAPDVILMDVQLPGMDGLELTRRLKADAATRHIPIVALTAGAMAADAARAREAGCDGYLTKPISAATLAESVDAVLRRIGAPVTGARPGPEPGEAEGEPPIDGARRSHAERSPAVGGPPRAARVLVVDDHSEGIELVRAYLAPEGHEVRAALTGSGALESALGDPPDLILLDVMLPDMDGYEVCRRLRAAERTRAVPVVMLTALREASDRIRGLEAGADDFLSKPVDHAELRARVRAHLRAKALTDELVAQRRELERHEEALRRANEALEAKVAERTADLRRANARLREELASREAAEAAARRSEGRYRALVEHFPNGAVILYDHNLRFVAAGGEALAHAQFSAAQVVGKTLHEVFPDEISRAVAPQYKAALRGTPSVSEVEFMSRVYEVRAVPVYAEEGEKVAGGMVMTQDVTERKLAEAEVLAVNQRLTQALAELEAAQERVVQQERLRALGEMASGIAHDFNNALAPVVGFAELLLETPGALTDEARVRGQLELIRDGASDAANVVRRLREFYRPREEGENLRPVNLAEVAEKALALTRPKWRGQAQASGRTIEAEVHCDPVPEVMGDEAALREALTNLIFNAVDAMPDGGKLEVRVSPDGRRVVLEVSDTGVGMSEEVRQKCLEPFFTTKGDDGTGLGLAMVYGIVRRHRGRLEIDSAPGKGTRIRISLPAVRDATAVEQEARDEPVEVEPLRVLLVDDDAPVQAVHAALLASLGHRVERAASGAEAIEKLREGRFDLVVTDQAMPGVSGTQVAAEVKRVSPSTRVVLLTGFATLMDAEDRPSEVDALLAKPTTLEALRDTIARVMGTPPSAGGADDN